MSEFVTLSHGSGGTGTHELIRNVFTPKFGITDPLTDSAILENDGCRLAFTTDSYVVNPVFFPGGNIGKLAVCGTVNDLAVSGAVPMYIAASFIIEEGFPFKDLEIIAGSMAGEALNANVRIVTGDTKVVDHGKCDMIYITTSGVGLMKPERVHLSAGLKIKSGDKLLVNGALGNHSVAVLGARNNLSFKSQVISDCASLNHLISNLLEKCDGIHFMRDLTRGGLTGVLNELSHIAGKGIIINENSVPVDEPVKGLCEILGFDPLNLANEGKALFVVKEGEEEKALSILKSHPLGRDAAIIGEITESRPGSVVLSTFTGGKRHLFPPSGIMLPRIC